MNTKKQYKSLNTSPGNYSHTTMKIVKHIAFYFDSNRFMYLNQLINAANSYNLKTDIFIHCNQSFDQILLTPYNNGNICIVSHDLSNINQHYLTWKCRKVLFEQRDDYDIFMYVEDDILVSNKVIEYWLNYNEKLLNLHYNLGFLRIENDVLNNNIEYTSDLPGKSLDKLIKIDGEFYCINDKNPYCAFWIYGKNDFKQFSETSYYHYENLKFENHLIREHSAFGQNLQQINKYKGTLIPVKNGQLVEDCKIYHLPNNYIRCNSPYLLGTVKYEDALSPALKYYLSKLD